MLACALFRGILPRRRRDVCVFVLLVEKRAVHACLRFFYDSTGVSATIFIATTTSANGPGSVARRLRTRGRSCLLLLERSAASKW